MRGRIVPLAIALIAAGVAAKAQPFQGLYVGAGAGYNLPQNVPLASGGQLEPQGGFVGLGSVGYGLGNGMRFEVEGDYRHANLGRTTGAFSTSGSMKTYAVMVNGLFDLDAGAPWIFPYLGGGLGYAWTNLSSQAAFTPASFPMLGNRVDQTQGGFAFQAIGGLSFPVPNVPGLSLATEYRFFAIPGRENFTGVQSLAGIASPAPFTLRAQHQSNHSFLLGVRYAFNVAAPVPVSPAQPPPAPAVARSYLVFFDWDKAMLDDRARQIIKEAADNSTHVQYTRIEVNGYTDTSGTHRYNQGLSVRRARAVQAELIKDGVPANVITIQGFGDTNLLVPTGPRVREPQNRRVEIIIR
jgi:outer membrane protein OmpA-like peptidoglycan-associated protein